MVKKTRPKPQFQSRFGARAGKMNVVSALRRSLRRSKRSKSSEGSQDKNRTGEKSREKEDVQVEEEEEEELGVVRKERQKEEEYERKSVQEKQDKMELKDDKEGKKLFYQYMRRKRVLSTGCVCNVGMQFYTLRSRCWPGLQAVRKSSRMPNAKSRLKVRSTLFMTA